MKLVRFAAVVAGAGVAQVLAVPFLVLPNNGAESTPSLNLRFGHAVPMRDTNIKTQAVSTGRVPCGRARFHQKSVEISNFLRQALGLPLVQVGDQSSQDGKVKILPFIGTAPIATFAPTYVGKEGGVKVYNIPDASQPRPHHVHHHHRPVHHHRHHRFGNESFVTRIHYSLMTLGRWEGRAVAFVLGCGIGVLLRMIWVFGVVMFRAIRGRRDDEHEYSQITIIEEVVDTPKTAPPTYTYPVDEKVAVAVETVAVPSTTEESK